MQLLIHTDCPNERAVGGGEGVTTYSVRMYTDVVC